MRTLVFATQNRYKVEEVNHVLHSRLNRSKTKQWNIIGLADIQCHDDIPETRDTLEGNALQKAEYVLEKFSYECFADDTGLEVDALGGQPGVYSARYAGPAKDFDANIKKLLKELDGSNNRKARFRTVIALVIDANQYFFEGTVEGHIIHEKRGSGGFGYDPVFIPDGFEKTFAEMSLHEKNKISHRAIATSRLIDFLMTYKTN